VPPLPSTVYAILDPAVARGRSLLELLEQVLAGGCRLVQLRDKTAPWSAQWPLALELRARCRRAGAWLIVNDRVDVALALEADGVHVGQDDLPAPAARRLLRAGMILGVSTHDVAQARAALAAGADYVAVGSMYPTGSKTGFQLVGPALLRQVRAEIPVPLVAIGGITEANAPDVMAAGADAVAVISAVCAAPEPAEATRRLLAAARREPAKGQER
jgi:thiamine-phosphate diphosphorylase